MTYIKRDMKRKLEEHGAYKLSNLQIGEQFVNRQDVAKLGVKWINLIIMDIFKISTTLYNP